MGGTRGRWITPAGSPQGGIILYFHGGGFIAECGAIHDPLLAAIGRIAGARGLMIDYRLAPEHPFPAATDDCFAAWNWMLSTGFDPARVVFAGDSGGRQPRARHRDARARRRPAAAGGAGADVAGARPDLQRPVIRAQRRRRPDVPRRDREPHPGLVRAGLDLADPRISPLFGSADGLPPTQIHVGSSELLLDDTLRYAAKAPGSLAAVWHGMPHVFPAIRGLVDGDRAIAEMADFIHAHTSEATRGA